MRLFLKPAGSALDKRSCAWRSRTRKHARRWRSLLLAAAVLCSLPLIRRAGFAQTAQPPVQLNAGAILDHLNAVINWYRHMMTMAQFAGEPSDAIYQSNAQSLSAKAVQLAFQSAKAEAALVPAVRHEEAGNAASLSAQRIAQIRDQINSRIGQLQAQIATLDAQISKSPRGKVQDLLTQKDSLAGELEFDRTRLRVIEQVAKLSEPGGEGNGGSLLTSVGQLERTVPELTGAALAAPKAGSAQSLPPDTKGLFGKAALLYNQLQSVRQISQLIDEDGKVQAAASALLSQLQAALRATIQQAQQFSGQLDQPEPAAAQAQASAQPPSPAQPLATRQQFGALAVRIQQMGDAIIPLRQEVLVLDQSRSNLGEWLDSIKVESSRSLRSILIQVGAIVIAIGFVLLLSELWRRVTFRYVHDARRRRQFLLVRRIVVGFCMGVVLILGFVSEFSSLATFAGFITAGLAVGLQTILLSVAAYFFLVGRWGIRVGDRVSVAGVTGDVVDVGLVRLYLMELSGTSVDLYQTGRIVVFSNSVLFQPTTPLFKQLPGTEYAWHEVAVELKPGTDYKRTEQQILEAVRSVYDQYRAEFERQHGDAERRVEIQVKMPEPNSQLQFSDTGLEYVVRYPVGLNRVSEIDDKLTRKLIDLVEQRPELKDGIVGQPRIRAAIKG